MTKSPLTRYSVGWGPAPRGFLTDGTLAEASSEAAASPRFPAQIRPRRLNELTGGERIHRLAALSTELYGADWKRGLIRDMRVGDRQVRRWKDGETPVPKVVLVALGAMVQAKRHGVLEQAEGA